MRRELTEELACAIGFDLIYRGHYFILDGVGFPNIKGKIVDGVARDVSVCYDTFPNGLDRLPPEAAIAMLTESFRQHTLPSVLNGFL